MIVESATEYAIFAIDLDGNIATWNTGARNVLGYEDDDIVGWNVSHIFTSEDRSRNSPEEEMRTAFETGRAEDKRWHVRKDGSRFWANGVLMPLRDDAGTINGYVKILRDETMQMEALEAAKRRTRRLEILTHAAADLLITRTPEEAMPALFNVMSEEFGIDAALSFVFDEEREELHLAASGGIPDAMRTTLSPLGDSVCKTAAMARRMLHVTDVQTSTDKEQAGVRALGLHAYCCFPLIANGRLLGTLGFGTRRRESFTAEDLALFGTLAQYVTAVRERRRAEEALRRSEARLRLAIDAGRMAVWESDTGRDIVSSSPELNRLLGFPDDANPTAAEIRERYYPGAREQLIAVAAEANARGESFAESEFRVIWPDGTIRWLLLRAELRKGANGEPSGAVGVALDITARKRDEERGRLLTNELNHRVKNTLATIQAVASQTFRNAKSLQDAREAFLDRLAAMANAHDILTRESWEGAELSDVATIAAAGFGSSDRIAASGPRLRLVPRTAIAVAMALHELATNAVKYGALSVEGGRVELTWSIDNDPGGKRLRMRWQELGGPPVEPPSRRGFGSRLIEDGLSRELGGQVRILFEPTGVICIADAPLPTSTETDMQ
jgi:PAS domain S-box-containing protein